MPCGFARIPVGELDAIVPVPADWGTWWRYGFHPAGQMARCIGRQVNVPVLPLIQVGRKRRRQTELPSLNEPETFAATSRPARGGPPRRGCHLVRH